MATTTIPIVIVIDPIALGLVASIARPGGNITGVTIAAGLNLLESVWDCWSRRCQTVHRRLPYVATILEDQEGRQREAAKRAGIALSPHLVNFTTEYQRVFRSMEQDRADAS
jgi:putative ABC transport system substrate-binding protein